MILKKVFNPLAVLRYMKTELLVAAFLSGAVYFLYHTRQTEQFSLPFSIAAILGSALAIFLAFRNNNAYSRWWEARTLWGNISNNSRILARQLIAGAENAVQTGKATETKAAAFTKEMVCRQIAFAHALRGQLRAQDTSADYSALLSPEELMAAKSKQNPANYLLLQQGRRIKEAIHSELLGAFDNISLEPTLAGFNNFQGGCERIRNTPLLRQYHFFTRLFLLVFMIVLPFSLIGDFNRMGMPGMMIPVSILISFVFGVMGKVGEVNEDPFAGRITDVPMTAICNTIERDLREMLGEKELPPKMNPENGFLN